MKPVHHEYLQANGWVIPDPRRWPCRAFIAAQLLRRFHDLNLLAGLTTHTTGRYG